MTNPDEHDPWNRPEDRHPRAQQLMAPELWDCADEDAPFGSDEGAEAYLATVLGQLVDEGRIDPAAKPFARQAMERQGSLADEHRGHLLRLAAAAVEAG